MDEKGGDLGNRPRTTRAAAITQNDGKTGRGVEELRQLRQLGLVFRLISMARFHRATALGSWGEKLVLKRILVVI